MDTDTPTLQENREQSLISRLDGYANYRRRAHIFIGRWVKGCREALGMSPSELASSSSASLQQIIEVEAGVYTMSNDDLESVMAAFRRQEKKGEAK